MITKNIRIISIVLTILLFVILFSAVLMAQEPAETRLNESPRHHEWVKTEYNGRTVHSFIVYPEIKDKALAVLVIHENRGLTDWVRSVADRLAENGYIAIAPDLLSGMAPDGGKTSDFKDRNAARDAIYALDPQQVTDDLKAVAAYVKQLEAGTGKLAVAGFCWGGSQTFRYATNATDIEAAFVFYGTAPQDLQDLQKIECPVYGFYGENDARVTSTVEKTGQLMQQLDKIYRPVVYDRAGHGFMRSGMDAESGENANSRAMKMAWDRWLELLADL